jgi:hypothetical protein
VEEANSQVVENTEAQQAQAPVDNAGVKTGGEDVSQNDLQGEASETREELPKYVQERLSRQERTHRKETQTLHRELQALRGFVEATVGRNPDQQHQQVSNAPFPAVDGVDQDEIQKTYRALEVIAQQNFKNQAQLKEQDKERKFAQALQKASEVYEDFDEVVRDENVPITKSIADHAKRLKNGPDVLYRLAKNRDELNALLSLHPDDQLDRMVEISAEMRAGKRQAPKAPEPTGAPMQSNPAVGSSKHPAEKTLEEIKQELKKRWSK